MATYYAKDPNKRRADAKIYRTTNPEKVKAATLAHYYANKEQYAAHCSRRRAVSTKATPSWANKKQIESLYKKARELTQQTGEIYCVDHVVPLLSPLVCGLHCEANLKIIPKLENDRKGNRYWPDMS